MLKKEIKDRKVKKYLGLETPRSWKGKITIVLFLKEGTQPVTENFPAFQQLHKKLD